jgi:hypothetical protein
MSQQLTSKSIIAEAQTLRKKSQELRHKSRNIRGVSVLWTEVSEALLIALLANRSRRVNDLTKEAEGDAQKETLAR